MTFEIVGHGMSARSDRDSAASTSGTRMKSASRPQNQYPLRSALRSDTPTDPMTGRGRPDSRYSEGRFVMWIDTFPLSQESPPRRATIPSVLFSPPVLYATSESPRSFSSSENWNVY